MLKEIPIRMNGNGTEVRSSEPAPNLHPAWKEFVSFCENLHFGEIERLKIQDGLPFLAEVTKKKVKFGS